MIRFQRVGSRSASSLLSIHDLGSNLRGTAESDDLWVCIPSRNKFHMTQALEELLRRDADYLTKYILRQEKVRVHSNSKTSEPVL